MTNENLVTTETTPDATESGTGNATLTDESTDADVESTRHTLPHPQASQTPR
ncbi:hypothetical protein [Nocardia sp. NRRL S-836]|uniref:hypothetical protein n=1 Tax=Nocardia sp. NRRL S-836 TaxID=1519492 RepID=UPI000A8994EA|nr:hypothetical protein [Nocardia sp. NRRL S-836]